MIQFTSIYEFGILIKIAFIVYCNSFLGDQLLHIAVYSIAFSATIDIAVAIVLSTIANALNDIEYENSIYLQTLKLSEIPL